MAASRRRCHYEVLGLRQDSTADEIRSAYKKLALQLHPDKLVQSGLSQADATAKFQELVQAYEVLSDPRERAWYDSHRSQILFVDPNSADTVPDSVIPNLFSYFSNTVYSGYADKGTGFYKVYSDVFNKIYANEISFATKLGLGSNSVREAPTMGNLDCPYAQVTAFYGYWLGFSTVMDFCWVDQYDAMAGPNRKSRRVMEEENKKLRKKAKREYNETVRGLAEFVKKRDKRVIDMMVKRNLEMEKKREEERERKKRLEMERLEKAMAYEEPEWSRIVEEEDEVEGDEDGFEEVDEKRKRDEGKELYCAVCGKKFKSEKQWKNHEQSKKHREKVAEFRDSIEDEDSLDVEDEERNEVDDGVDELGEQMRDGFRIGEEVVEENDRDCEFYDVDNANKVEEKSGTDVEDNDDDSNEKKEDEDDEMGVLEAMLTGRKNRKNRFPRRGPNETSSTNVHIENDSGEFDFRDYNNTKNTRRKRGARKEKSKKKGEEIERDGTNHNQNDSSNGNDNSQAEESSSHSFAENGINVKGDDSSSDDNKKGSNQRLDRKGIDTNTKSKNSSKAKGKKANAKATSKNSSNTCEKCGEDFESRNKLHKHLSDTGHAALKFR
ncbi:TFIIH C1-like domain containing protein [Parasponia andersonii]|uniref:TFIIH C1-like domain containing protein n=1 Tax=Parasponia andersonii TaxID=3476 RepID=A0A2P5A7X4_PARAD|nr:TFIIH C1-like domain containing protein [Parasponia andersonii]